MATRDEIHIRNLVFPKCLFEEVKIVLDQQNWAARSLASDWRSWLAAVKEDGNSDGITNRESLYHKVTKKVGFSMMLAISNLTFSRPVLKLVPLMMTILSSGSN